MTESEFLIFKAATGQAAVMGKGDCSRISKPLDTGSIIARQIPQVLNKGSKRMVRNKGAQLGNRNAVTHGRYSAETRAQRLAGQCRTAPDKWMAKIPTWDWHATCAEIERSAASNKLPADRVRVI
jgi:hypothetical protein